MELVQPSLLGRIIGRQKLYFITSRAGSDVDMCSKTFQNILKHFKSIVFPWNLSNKLFPWILISWPFFETSVMMFSRIIEYLLELATLWLWFCEFVSCQSIHAQFSGDRTALKRGAWQWKTMKTILPCVAVGIYSVWHASIYARQPPKVGMDSDTCQSVRACMWLFIHPSMRYVVRMIH